MMEKIKLFAVGVSRYQHAALNDLMSPNGDIKSLYDCLENVLGANFSRSDSVCLQNPTAQQFRSCYEAFSNSCGLTDQTILYFSGHGTLLHDELLLHFHDSDVDRFGCLSARELHALLSRTRGEKLFVLDCCHAGGATSIVQAASIFYNSKISVVASSGALESSRESSDGSEFTNAFVGTFLSMHKEGASLSLNSLIERIKKSSFPGDVRIQLHDGLRDLIFPSEHTPPETMSHYVEAFQRALNSSNSAERTVMWYHLCKEPELVRLSVLELAGPSAPMEATWLGRRAIGSCIDSIESLQSRKIDLCLKLIESKSWVANCIGLIGGRKELAHERLRLAYSRVLSDNRKSMDAVWLSLIYLGDHGALNLATLQGALKGNLGRTSWGKIELLRQMLKIDLSASTEFANSLMDYEQDIDEKAYLSRSIQLLLAETGFIAETLEMDDVSHYLGRLATGKRRDRTSRFGLEKWFFSKLYGDWREHVQEDYAEFIDESDLSVVSSVLTALSDVELVSVKLAFFDALRRRPDLARKTLDAWRWSLDDRHPWVFREAWRTYFSVVEPDIEDKAVSKVLQGGKSFDRLLYPGGIEAFIPIAINLCANGKFQQMRKIFENNRISTSDGSIIKDYVFREGFRFE